MSTIHDALKKAQEKMNQASPKGNEPSTENNPSTENLKPQLGDERFSPPPTTSSRTSEFSSPAGNIASQTILSPLATPKTNPARPPAADKKKKRSPLWVAIYVIAFVTVLFLIADHFHLSPSLPQLSSFTKPQKKTSSGQINGELVINGIIKMDDKDVVLLNNKIYETGEMVGDMQITEITTDTVKLSKDGKEKILKVR
jgi:hypothetical protein